MPNHTPLYAQHLALHAKMVDFHGWMLPLQYTSSIQEHLAVRKKAGIFDVSHMTIVDILGTGGRQFLRKILTQDVDTLTHPGSALYSCMCNEHGGILDDLIVYYRALDNYRLVLNAATKDQDLAWLQAKSQGFSLGIQTRPELAIIAIQGPDTFSLLEKVLTPAQLDAISTLKRFQCVDIEQDFFAYTGYTGEKGLEVMLPHDHAVRLWEALIQQGFTPCGLAARDSLRLEAGLMLYGQDMDASTTPLESGLAWTIQWEPQDRNFIGMGALLSQKDHLQKKLVGLTLQEKGIMRKGQRVVIEGQPDGLITSGGFSPILNTSIALARVPITTPDHAQVEIRDKLLSVQISRPRFL